ncbi:hypothetical protein OKA05_06750 [Luteolibacter arcticus]|uniref:PpiC domain-containing protein n=1 Tax=Luteolibacter arcticus TaxID=1581411 RepID=A0ABT3GF67_9BACT|nr:hypothetical protein [Luteolibacter arcticus]MCW1922245.1 hypothetical protein [Luteolibacter arcticus]
MNKYVASGLLVLAFAAMPGMRPTRGSVAAAAIAPTLPTKVRDRSAASSGPVEGFVLDLEFRKDEVEWPALLKERYLGSVDWRVGVLEEKLVLSPDQQAQVAAWRAQIAQQLDAAKTSAEASHFATPREVEAFLRPLLDEDQTAALAVLKKDEHSQCVASITSSQFSRLAQVAGLGTERQAEVATALAGDAEAVAAFRLDDPRPLELFISNFDKDPQALGIEHLSWEWLGEDGLTLIVDHPLKRQFIRDVQARIDSRVASLESVLTPAQRETYREYLRKNWSGNPWHQLLFPPLDPGR